MKIENLINGQFVELRKRQGMSQVYYSSSVDPAIEFDLSESNTITGICSYQYMMQGQAVCGILFTSPAHITSVQPYKYTVRATKNEESFAPSSFFDPQGVYGFISEEGSFLAIAETNSSLIVRVSGESNA